MFRWTDGPSESTGESNLDAQWEDVRTRRPIPVRQGAEIGAKFLMSRQHGKAIEVYREILREAPSYQDALQGMGTALLRTERYEEAQQVLLEAMQRSPQDVDIKLKLGTAYKEVGRLQQAIDIFEEVRRECPNELAAHVLLAQTELMRGEYDNAMRAYTVGSACPGNKTVLRAVYWTILALQNRIRDLEEWADPKQLVRVVHCDNALVQSLNLGLKRQILDSPGTRPLGSQRTLHLTDMVAPDHHGQSIKAFHDMTRSEIERYIDQPHIAAVMPELHDMETAWLSVWALIFREKGNLDGHFHQAALVSGAYYVQCGNVGGPDTREGWISFGMLPKEIERGMPSTPLKEACRRLSWAIRPEDGMMVLFPSFLFHGTIPTQTGDRRICLGLDLRPGEFRH